MLLGGTCAQPNQGRDIQFVSAYVISSTLAMLSNLLSFIEFLFELHEDFEAGSVRFCKLETCRWIFGSHCASLDDVPCQFSLFAFHMINLWANLGFAKSVASSNDVLKPIVIAVVSFTSWPTARMWFSSFVAHSFGYFIICMVTGAITMCWYVMNSNAHEKLKCSHIWLGLNVGSMEPPCC